MHLFRTYRKTMLTALVVMGWAWCTTNSCAALNSRSDLGVVLGLLGVVTSAFTAIWLIAIIHKKRENHEKASTFSGNGGAGPNN